MQNYPKSLFLENVFSSLELDELASHFSEQSVAHHYVPQNTKNKNLDYDIDGSPVNRIVKPKLAEILHDPEHEFFGGAYKEYTIPFQLHVDNVLPTAKLTFRKQTRHSTAFLIPMVEHECLKTAIFDVFFPIGHNFHAMGSTEQALKELEPFLSAENNSADVDDFDHLKDPFLSLVSHIPVDRIQPWKLGSVITWHFDQLHCSTNFAKFGITKKFMVLMIN